jgi:hypothetical protein
MREPVVVCCAVRRLLVSARRQIVMLVISPARRAQGADEALWRAKTCALTRACQWAHAEPDWVCVQNKLPRPLPRPACDSSWRTPGPVAARAHEHAHLSIKPGASSQWVSRSRRVLRTCTWGTGGRRQQTAAADARAQQQPQDACVRGMAWVARVGAAACCSGHCSSHPQRLSLHTPPTSACQLSHSRRGPATPHASSMLHSLSPGLCCAHVWRKRTHTAAACPHPHAC